jgi:putative ABC transport system permease protein
MNEWLTGFAYRIQLTPEMFAFAGVMVIFIAWVTISARSIQAATANPVNSLRNE